MTQFLPPILSPVLVANQVADFTDLLALPREAWIATRNAPPWLDFFEAGPAAVSSLFIPHPPEGRFLPLLAVPPELRTGHGERMIFSELAIEWMGMLLCADLLQPETFPTLSHIRAHLRDVVDEIRELYLDRGNLPTLFTEDLLNRVFQRRFEMAERGEEGPIAIPIVRIHVNLTTANKIDDSKGLVGTSLLAS